MVICPRVIVFVVCPNGSNVLAVVVLWDCDFWCVVWYVGGWMGWLVVGFVGGWEGLGRVGGPSAQWISLTSMLCYNYNKNVTFVLQQMLPLKYELRFLKVIVINLIML